jgi:NTE family protein
MIEKRKATVILGGGSALGLAHIGVLSELEREFEICGIIGTSMGAIVGGLYARGLDCEAILEIAGRISNAKVLSPLNIDLRIGGLFDGIAAHKLFREWTNDALIEEGRMPFVACAYDLASRSTVLFDKGFYADAMRASSSVPYIFTPYMFKQYQLVDGGIEHPLPLEFASMIKSEVTIAVNVLPMVQQNAQRVNLSDTSTRRVKRLLRTEVVIQSVFQNQAYLALRDTINYEPDIVIEAAMPHANPFAFHKYNEFYRWGKKIAKQTLSEYREPNFIDLIRKHYRNLIHKSSPLI